MSQCGKCGAKVFAGARFCGQCKTPVEPPPAPAFPNSPATKQTAAPMGLAALIAIAAIVACVFLVGVLTVLEGDSEPAAKKADKPLFGLSAECDFAARAWAKCAVFQAKNLPAPEGECAVIAPKGCDDSDMKMASTMYLKTEFWMLKFDEGRAARLHNELLKLHLFR